MSINSIGELLRLFLLGDVTVAGLITTRAYPLRLPQKPTLPAVVIQRISGERIGQLKGQASAAEPRYQVDAWASDVAGALALGNAIRQRLENYTGPWSDGSSPSDEVFVQIRFITERDLFEEDILGGLCRHSADYFVFHSTNGGAL